MSIQVYELKTPPWIAALGDCIAMYMHSDSLMGPIGFTWWEPGSECNPSSDWVIYAYPTANEIQGGPHDGAVAVSAFKLDLNALAAVFSEITGLEWSSPARYNGNFDGPSVTFTGSFAGQPVKMRIFHLPPQDEAPSLVIDTLKSAWRVKER